MLFQDLYLKWIQKSAKELGEVSALNFQCKFRDVEKQERFDRYCNNIKLGKLDPYAGLRPNDFTDWELRKEKAEFERAATQKSTITSIMASRFKRADYKDSDTNVELAKTKVRILHLRRILVTRSFRKKILLSMMSP